MYPKVLQNVRSSLNPMNHGNLGADVLNPPSYLIYRQIKLPAHLAQRSPPAEPHPS